MFGPTVPARGFQAEESTGRLRNVHSSIWLIVFSIGVVQGLFLCAALLAMSNENVRATRLLAGLVLVFTLLIFGEILELWLSMPAELLVTVTNINTELAIGPLLLLFSRHVLDPDLRFRRSNLLHFLPLLIGLVAWLILLQMIYQERLPLTRAGFQNLIAGYVLFKAVFIYTYMGFALCTLRRGLTSVDRFVAGRKTFGMQWLVRWYWGLGVVAAAIYAAFFLGHFGLPVPDSDKIGSLILAVMIYLLSCMVLLRPWVLSVRPRKADQERYADDIGRLKAHLYQAQSFLDPELTLGQLAQDLGMSENHLSATINEGMQLTFGELIARYRLAEFERLATDPQKRDRSVLELAFASGFNSKASFYRLFRRAHGMTPSAFRQMT